MMREMISHETRLRVRYAETDQMGVVYHANYLVWMEVGRAELCRAIGIRYRDMEKEAGVLLAVADVHCRYIASARYDEEIVVKTWIERSNPRVIEFAYEMRNAETDQLLATGGTKHVFLNAEMHPVKLPERYHAAFGIESRSAITSRT